MEDMREIIKTLPDYEDDVPMSDEEREILENNVAPVLREPLPAIEQVPDVGMTPVVASSQGVVPTQKVVPPSGADTAPADVSATNVAKPSSSPTGTAQKNSGVNKRGHSNVCVLCMRSHNLRSCRKFLNMRLEQRLRTVVLHRVCSNCLGRSHMRSTCNSRETSNNVLPLKPCRRESPSQVRPLTRPRTVSRVPLPYLNRPDPCCHPIVVGSRYDTGTFRVSPAGRPKVLPSFRGGVGSRARCLRTGSKDTNIFESWIPIGAANDVWIVSGQCQP
ncbi:uncharacterized protein LOC142221588 [Haematobia irritans]|uniref:uncharacterized protein LOC142221588 n=1 Tax=Haematobia irritans TaxID=7368 RepID=UPI003F503A9C